MKNLDSLILKYKKGECKLITLLEEIVKLNGSLSFESLNYLSKNLKIPLAKLYTPASFYSFLPTTKKGKYIIRICNNLSCCLNGSENIIELLKKELRINLGETTKDGKFSLELTSCLGCCDSAPAMMINNKVYVKLDKNKVHEILRELK